ncbi:MAG TPA: helix-turn-helix transcriptional regulator [Chitinophagales bacterium]|nr:helix-turn-helix transcriptional regulator [Chitinophagales bacterium]
MKEEQERLLRYIGEIFEKRRQGKIEQPDTKPGDDDVDVVNAGKKIRKLREQKGISLEQLAERTGLIVPYIQQIEIGEANPYMTEIYDISKALGVEISVLFGKK